MEKELGFKLPIQRDWQKLSLADIKSPDAFPLSFTTPKDFNKFASILRGLLEQKLIDCKNLIVLAFLFYWCAKMQHLHNRFCANGYASESIYDNNTANKMLVLLYDTVSYDLSEHPIKYMDLHLYQGPFLTTGGCGEALYKQNGQDTFYIVNDLVKTAPVFNRDVKDVRMVESVMVLSYIMHNTLQALYTASPQGHVDGIVFQNICCNSFNFTEMQNIFNGRKLAERQKSPYFNDKDYYKLMDQSLPQINNYLSVAVTFVGRTGGGR